MAVITILPPSMSVKIRCVQPGDFFRFTSGAVTDAFVALSKSQKSFDNILLCRNLNTGKLKQFYVNTHKEREVTLLEPVKMEFKDTSLTTAPDIQDDDETPVRRINPDEGKNK